MGLYQREPDRVVSLSRTRGSFTTHGRLSTPESAVSATYRLGHATGHCRFAPPVTHVYNPLDYASEAHRLYLELYCRPGAEVLLVGMNPGPYGMVQTGVPFGEVAAVRDWLGISTGVVPPAKQHPKRPVLGFECTRSEVSGRRLWGWAQERFGTPDAFFDRFFIWNYCPLAFLEASGRNRTPDKLPAAERVPLYEACDRALADIAAYVAPSMVLGVGAYAEARARAVLGGEYRIGRILHPSPASPAANSGWAQQVEEQLEALGVVLP